MLCFYVVSFVFYYLPAPTEIHPFGSSLSLPDALPFYLVAVTRVGRERELAGAGAGQRRHGGNPGFAVAAKFEPEARGDLGGGVGRPGHGLLAGAALERDRKSTSLNSSH